MPTRITKTLLEAVPDGTISTGVIEKKSAYEAAKEEGRDEGKEEGIGVDERRALISIRGKSIGEERVAELASIEDVGGLRALVDALLR